MLPTNTVLKLILGSLTAIACGAVVYFVLPMASSNLEYNSKEPIDDKKSQIIKDKSEASDGVKPAIPDARASLSTIPVTHISTPEKVKAVYLSAWVAGNSKYRNPIIKMIDETELNSVVIDIKDSTGKLSFTFTDPDVSRYGAAENRIADIRSLTNLLHQKNIYIIGRVSVFQDPHMTKLKPQWSITKKSDGTVWKDRKGLSFLNPVSEDVHKYIVAIGRGAYAEGFDEINFDEEDKAFVWVLDENQKLKKRYVEVGLEGDIYTEIKDDISETIVTPVNAEDDVQEGFKVRIINE